MTMMQKVQAKRSKKGFTLVELVIVIAILAILAAIAIPVITTTINSSKLSTMESDKATANMLLKEAINASKASIKTTTWNGDDNNYLSATVDDVLRESELVTTANADHFYTRHIGGEDYTLVWTDAHNVAIQGGAYAETGTPIEGMAVTELEPGEA